MKRGAKYTASVSLGVMAAGFAATFPFSHLAPVFVLQSGFEAGLVGGLADWFAVTALFRHPLGIPIPHTALLPRNRAKVTNALVNAIQTNLLNKESIIAKLEQVRVAPRLAELAEQELAKEDAGERIARLVDSLLRSMPADEVADALLAPVREAVRSADARGLLAALGREAAARGFDERLLDYALDYGERLALSAEVRRLLGEAALRSLGTMRQGGLMGFALNAVSGWMDEDRIGAMLQEWLLAQLYEMRRPGNETREAAAGALRAMLLDLGGNEALAGEIERLKEEAARPGGAADRFARGALERALNRLADPEFCQANVVPLLREALRRFRSEEGAADKLDAWLRKQAAGLIESNHGAIGRLVKENADKLSDESLIEMLEKHVGKDLQWIRVNGALCGFAIGIALGLLQLFVPGG